MNEFLLSMLQHGLLTLALTGALGAVLAIFVIGIVGMFLFGMWVFQIASSARRR